MRLWIGGCRLASRWLLLGASTVLTWYQLHGVGGASANGLSPRVSPEIRRDTEKGLTRVRVEVRVPRRQFETVPFLALEIDAEALRVLENMGALVARVMPDETMAPAARP